MGITELRDLDSARRYLVQGLRIQHVLPAAPPTVGHVLDWALEIAATGQPLPPVGFVADVGHTAFGMDESGRRDRHGPRPLGLPPTLARAYEDHVLGKVYADPTFERAADALRRYQGRDRARGLAFVITQLRERGGLGGAHLSPAVIKSLQREAPERVLAEGEDALTHEGPMPLLVTLYESLCGAARRLQELLGPEDVFELEHRTALDDLGQRVALRQVLRCADRLEAYLPRHRVRPRAGRQEVPTRVLDEDTYPVGGFSSLSTRGTVESLLHSQLAYMERDERPDLFDIKYLRDELLYYARDENQFLRRRRSFVFALARDLTEARYKDADLPWQRIVLVLGLLLAAVRKLTEWLSADALLFEFVFLGKGEPDALADERRLVETLLREQIANGTVRVARLPPTELEGHCGMRSRRSLCHALLVSARAEGDSATSTVTQLLADGPRPSLVEARGPVELPEADEPAESWGRALEYLLQGWV